MRNKILGTGGILIIVASVVGAVDENSVLEQWWNRLNRTVEIYETELEAQQVGGLAQLEIASAEHRLLLDQARRELGVDVWIAVETRAQAEPGRESQRAYHQALSLAQQRFQRAVSKAYHSYTQGIAYTFDAWTEGADERLEVVHEDLSLHLQTLLRGGGEREEGEEMEDEEIPEAPENLLQVAPPIPSEGEDNPEAQLRKALAQARKGYEATLATAAETYDQQIRDGMAQIQQGGLDPFEGSEKLKKALKVYRLTTLDALETWRAAVRQAVRKYQLENA